jgi:hypothetical protein
MSEYFRNLSRNGTTNILNSYILLKNSLSQSEATEPSETVASLSFNSPSKSGNTLFRTHSQHVLMATQPLAQDQGLQVAKNNFPWVRRTHNDLSHSLYFYIFMYKYKVLPPSIIIYFSPLHRPQAENNPNIICFDLHHWSNTLTFSVFVYNFYIQAR